MCHTTHCPTPTLYSTTTVSLTISRPSQLITVNSTICTTLVPLKDVMQALCRLHTMPPPRKKYRQTDGQSKLGKSLRIDHVVL